VGREAHVAPFRHADRVPGPWHRQNRNQFL
jgi:hypothetical protein